MTLSGYTYAFAFASSLILLNLTGCNSGTTGSSDAGEPVQETQGTTLNVNIPSSSPRTANSGWTVLGIPIGSPWPTNLPECEPSNDQRPPLCYGTTQGGLNAQSPVKWQSYTLIPVTPTINLPGFEFPELLENNLFPGFFVFVDDGGLVQGLFVNSVTADSSQVIAMLNAKYGSNMETVTKKTQMSPGEVVSVLHYYWSLPALSVHYGPPPNMPLSSFKIIEVFGTKLRQDNDRARGS